MSSQFERTSHQFSRWRDTSANCQKDPFHNPHSKQDILVSPVGQTKTRNNEKSGILMLENGDRQSYHQHAETIQCNSTWDITCIVT